MPVTASTWRAVHAGPPTEYAAFQVAPDSAGTAPPSAVLHDGRSTRVSRGIEMPYADFRPSAMCSRIVVSDPPSPASLSMPHPAQSRESVPISRMFICEVGSGFLVRGSMM